MKTLQLTEPTIEVIVKSHNYRDVLKELNENFFYSHNDYVKKSYKQAGVTLKQAEAALKEIEELNRNISRKFTNWSNDSIIDYIINTHHHHARKNAIIIFDLAEKVLYRHNKNHPELSKLSTVLFLFLQDLLTYFKKEEQVLLPCIMQLNNAENQFKTIDPSAHSLIKESIIKMRIQHISLYKNLELLRSLTNNYTLPKDACHYYKDLFKKLKEFENNLFLHVLLENSILFPRATLLMKGIENNLTAH